MTSDPPNKPKSQDIPLLEDVVIPDDLEIDSGFVVFDDNKPTSFDAATPEYDEVLLAMRDDILAQLEGELHASIVSAVEQAIDEAGERLSLILHKELTGKLEQRIRHLIEQRMEREFGPREHPLDEREKE
jgi:hypothetical protein